MINATTMLLLETLGAISDGELDERDKAVATARKLADLLEGATAEDLDAVCILQDNALGEDEDEDGEPILIGDFQVQCAPDAFEAAEE